MLNSSKKQLKLGWFYRDRNCFGSTLCSRKSWHQKVSIRIIRYNVVQRDFPVNNIDWNVMFWQQDRAHSHTSNVTMQHFRSQFPGCVMSKRSDWSWPLRPPYLTVWKYSQWWRYSLTAQFKDMQLCITRSALWCFCPPIPIAHPIFHAERKCKRPCQTFSLAEFIYKKL